jgi:glycosyltransferase involved in cell wall biosynthesis
VAQQPRFSVVMPAYNAAATIEAAIGSVLAQDSGDWELVITDDGSTDKTRSICERFAESDSRISVHSQDNAGTGAAISAAIERSVGEFVVQLGADDELLPEYCSATAQFVAEHPGYDIYASNAYRLMPDGRRELYHSGPKFRQIISLSTDDLIDEPQIFGTAAFRRTLFHRLGGFRTEFYNEDYDFWLRALADGARHIYNPRPLALYRVVPGQKTADGVRMRSEDIRILQDAIASGKLTEPQVEHARSTIALLDKNVAFRRGVLRIVGPRLAEPVFKAAHKAAWLVRPHRRRS